MKFAHLADCHLGSWREPKLREANAQAFVSAIDRCLSEKVNFVLLSGDLFNTAVPGIDSLKLAVEQLKRLHDADVPLYFIAGSHDFSPSGKTMLDVLEHAGLGVNVAKGEELPDNRIKLHFTLDKSGAKIVGLIGKKGGLESNYYKLLSRENLENESGFRIFLFHNALAELKPKDLSGMDALAVSLLPAGFDYYAGGHVHVVDKASMGKYKNIVFPGPVFPNSFAELEKLKQGSFVLFDGGNIQHVPLQTHPVVCVSVDAENKSLSEVETEIRKLPNVNNAIVTIRVSGCLKSGRPADLRWNDIFHDVYAKGAFVVLKNTNAFSSKELEVIMVKEANVEEVETSLLQQHSSQFKFSGDDVELAKKLMLVLSAEKLEGERVADFESRVHSELDRLLE
ncbi:DNA double-strand break repair protein Mre11 [uncultured archaeon]|nr:DNA double-strand break repair protein Mre11 [uncultured archaeon]